MGVTKIAVSDHNVDFGNLAVFEKHWIDWNENVCEQLNGQFEVPVLLHTDGARTTVQQLFPHEINISRVEQRRHSERKSTSE